MSDGDDLIVCRCEEITLGDIRQAIADGARTVTGVKRRTRAGMGLCQGRSCEQAVARLLAEMLSVPVSEVLPASSRPPAVPVPFGVLAADGGDDR